MKRIWAPWRMKFMESTDSDCVFCTLQRQADGPQNLVVRRGAACFVLLNRYPYTSGHLMVVANEHRATLEELEAATRGEMLELATHAMTVLRGLYHPDGFNLGANIGAAAGAGIAGHVHLHVVPRWVGDSNFMLTLAETKVLPETLEETYRRVCERWGKK
jgi:ATP adenylyltransferase